MWHPRVRWALYADKGHTVLTPEASREELTSAVEAPTCQ